MAVARERGWKTFFWNSSYLSKRLVLSWSETICLPDKLDLLPYFLEQKQISDLKGHLL